MSIVLQGLGAAGGPMIRQGYTGLAGPIPTASPAQIFTAVPGGLQATPSPFPMASTETLPLALNVAPMMAAGETPSAPSVVLTNLATDTPYAAGLSGAADFDDLLLLITVTALVKGQAYRLAFTWTAATGKVWTQYVQLNCLF